MTGNDIAEGTRAHRSGKRRFWAANIVWVVAALAVGLAMRAAQHGRGPGSLSQEAAVAFAIIIPAMMAIAGRVLFQVADELDARDNLVALAVGFVANMAIIIAWFMLFLGALTPAPSAEFSLLGAALVTVAAYGWLKLRR